MMPRPTRSMLRSTRSVWIAGLALAVALPMLGCSKTDAGITTAVKSKIAADEAVKAYQVDVDTRDHVVTLSGNVDTAVARDQAVQIARNTEGVSSVVDNLVVAPAAATTGIADATGDLERSANEAADKTKNAVESAADKGREGVNTAGAVISDAAVTSAVKTKLLADPSTSGLKIDVDTDDGAVTLSGPVSSKAERDHAVKIARETTGVHSVVDRLTVK